MSDNVIVNPGSGGATIRTKARGSVETPVSLLDIGGDSSERLVGDSGVFMPVEGGVASGSPSTAKPVVSGAVFGGADLSTDGHVGSLNIDSKRNLRTVLRDAAGGVNGLSIDTSGAILVSNQHSEDFDTRSDQTDNTSCFGIAVPSSTGAVAVGSSSVGASLGLNVFPVGSHSANFTTDEDNTADNTIAFGIAVPGTNGAQVVGGSSAGGLLVDLGSNNDIKLHDGSGQPLSSVLFSDSVRYLGVSTVDSIAAYKDDEEWTTGTSYHFLTGSVYVDDNDWVAIGNKETSPLRSDTNGSLCSTLRAFNGDPISTTSVNNDVGLDVNVLNQSVEVTSIPSVTIGSIPSDANVGIVGRSAGGLSSHKTVQYPTGSTAGSVTVSSSACTAYSITAFNMTATPIFLKIYDSSSSASSSDTPILTYVVPANSQLSGAGFSLNVPQGIAFSAGLTYRASTVLDDDDGGTAYPTSGDLVLNILYKG
jgi:hypothetical protein